MSIHRFWIEIVMVATAVACALALLIATLGAVAGAAGTALGQQSKPPVTPQTYEGIVTCSRCGARHAAKFNQSAADCARVCVHGGAQFALVDGEKLYLLDGDLNLLKRIAGERHRILGSLTGNTIRVSSVAAGS
jgi:hypothetical protein